MPKRRKITADELIRQYNRGNRDFRRIRIWDWRNDVFNGVDLRGINLEDTFIDINLSGAILRNANFKNSIWVSGDWQNIDFTDSNMIGVSNVDSFIFTRCDFSGTVWSNVKFFQSTFVDCNLSFTDFDNASLVEVDLYG